MKNHIFKITAFILFILCILTNFTVESVEANEIIEAGTSQYDTVVCTINGGHGVACSTPVRIGSCIREVACRAL